MIFYLLDKIYNKPPKIKDVFCLFYDNWDDYGHKTLFNLTYYDNNGTPNKIGAIKIAYDTQSYNSSEYATYLVLKAQIGKNFFYSLSNDFFSLGQ